MAKIVEQIIKIKADVAEAASEIKNLFADLLEKQVDADKQQKVLNDEIKNLGETSKKAEKGINSMANGFKGVGLAIKAMGIGLLLSALQVLKDVFASNQKVVDGFSTGMNFLKIAFKDLFELIEKNIKPVGDFFKNIFENPQESIKKLGELIKENLIERFKSFIDTIGYLGSALGKLFKGDFEGAVADAKKGGKEIVDVFTGVNNSVDRASQAVKDAADAVSAYVSKTLSAAEKLTQITKNIEAQALAQERLVQQYEQQAEVQRQLRDDESAVIKDRIAANNKLEGILIAQGEAEKKTIALRIGGLQAEQAALGFSEERKNAIFALETQRLGVINKITGALSEQKVNAVSLDKDLKALNQTEIDGLSKRAGEYKKFIDSLIKDNTDRLEAERKTILEEAKLEEERLTTKRNLYKLGTQAYADAQQEILNLQASTNQSLTENDKKTQETIAAEAEARLNRIIAGERNSFETRFTALDEQLVAINEKEFGSEEERTAAVEANTNARIALGEAEYEAKKKILGDIGNVLANASALAGENTAAGKGLAIAATTISTYQSSVDAYKGMVAAIPGPAGIAAGAAAATVSIATGLATVKKILSVKIPGKGGSAGGGSAGGAPAPQAQFNIVGSSSTNQLAQTISQQQRQSPLQAFVVGSEVTSQQALDRNRINNSTFL